VKFAPRYCHRLAAWLALVGLVLQIGLTTAHSARHFDHLVGPLHEEGVAFARGEPHTDPGASLPDRPDAPDRDHCVIDSCLAAAGGGVLADPGLVPVPLSFAIARLDVASTAIIPAERRHLLPPARAPPVVEIIA
jgi:hypothetical protein